MPDTRPEHMPSSDEFTAARTGNFFVRDGVLLPTEDFINNTDGCRTRLKGTYMVQESVRVIGHGTFRNCTNLQAVLLPDGVTTIEPLAFAGCSSLTRLAAASHDTGQPEVVLPHSIETIGFKAFSGCSQITQVCFESHLTHLAPNTFEDCVRLERVEGCNSLGHIGRAAFRGCDDLQELVGLKGTCVIEPYAFAGCERFEMPTVSSALEEEVAEAEDLELKRTPQESESPVDVSDTVEQPVTPEEEPPAELIEEVEMPHEEPEVEIPAVIPADEEETPEKKKEKPQPRKELIEPKKPKPKATKKAKPAAKSKPTSKRKFLALVIAAVVVIAAVAVWAATRNPKVPGQSGPNNSAETTSTAQPVPVSVAQELSNGKLYDQNAIEHLDPTFINAKVDTTDSSLGSYTAPTVTGKQGAWHYVDKYFNLATTSDSVNKNLSSYQSSWTWTGYRNAPAGSVIPWGYAISIKTFPKEKPRPLSSQAVAAAFMYPQNAGGDYKVMNSGVTEINKESYVYLRYQVPKAGSDSMILARSVNGRQACIEFSIYNSSLATKDLLANLMAPN